MGTIVGAPPVRVTATLKKVDSKALTGVIGFFVNGLMASHPELTGPIAATLKPAGMDFLRATAPQCTAGIMMTASYSSTNKFTRNGKTIIDALGLTHRSVPC